MSVETTGDCSWSTAEMANGIDSNHPQHDGAQAGNRSGSVTAGHWLIVAAILIAGFGGGLLAWHPWESTPHLEPSFSEDSSHVIYTRQETGGADDLHGTYGLTRCYGNTASPRVVYGCVFIPSRVQPSSS